jgi:hypothetical protein
VKNFIMILLIGLPLQLFPQESPNNILIYGEGNVQVTSEVNEYQNISAGMPIEGTVMITHHENSRVDTTTFRMGDKPLKVEFVQSVAMSDNGSLVVSIYKFNLEGKSKGVYTLPPIQVQVDGKYYQAAPLIIQVNP